jgi:hypothetical protein
MMVRRKLLAAATVPVVIMMTAVAAHAADPTDPPPQTRIAWPGGTICAHGTIGAGARTTTVPAWTRLLVTVEPCAGTDLATVQRARWGVATYDGGYGEVGTSGIYQFPGTEAWGRQLPGFEDGALRGTQAVCLVTGPWGRLACVRVEAVGAAGTVTYTPLATDDPLVDTPLRVVGGDGNPNPECAACV